MTKMKFETVEPALGQMGFYRHSIYEILPAMVIRKPTVKEDKKVGEGDKVVVEKSIKADILVFGINVGGMTEPKREREVGIKVGCWWPDLKELETAIEYERKQRDPANQS